MDRLQKIIAHAGVASRRKAEELIVAGRVTVNGKVVTELGSRADARHDHIRIDGKPLAGPEQPLYLMFNKPRGVVSTLSDPEGRPTVADFIRGARQRLYPVGRLDYHSEGLLLLTNDGELAHRVMHASSELPKTYWAKVAGRPEERQLEKLRAGIYLEGRRTAPAKIRWLAAHAGEKRGMKRTSDENPWLEIVLIEGRQNQIRRMFQSVGHPVEKLKRIRIGPLELGRLAPGELREMSSAEMAKLRRAATSGPAKPKKAPASARETPPRRHSDARQ
jgi:23S rRNA pseudouridine2605 synthase